MTMQHELEYHENIAYSWNKELAYENGEITLGESTLVLNLPIMIGPGMNIHRHAYNSRGAEYYSEDPILTGYIGSAVVRSTVKGYSCKYQARSIQRSRSTVQESRYS